MRTSAHPQHQVVAATLHSRNRLVENHTYEATSNRMQQFSVKQGSTVRMQRDYTYHTGGNVKTLTSTNAGSGVSTIAYGYDQLDRVKQACAWNLGTSQCISGQLNESYAYDSIGNITSKAGMAYSYGTSQPHAVKTAGVQSYTYDANGNTLSGAGRTYTWNGENQPVRIVVGQVTDTYT